MQVASSSSNHKSEKCILLASCERLKIIDNIPTGLLVSVLPMKSCVILCKLL